MTHQKGASVKDMKNTRETKYGIAGRKNYYTKCFDSTPDLKKKCNFRFRIMD